jgi:GNAT superfamily N-acetyltransferase
VTSVEVTRLAAPAADQLAEVAGLFDQYRQHYGEPSAPERTLRWLEQHAAADAGAGRLTVFTARADGELIGLATTVELPASLGLGCFWQLRDLYVVPAARRRGTAGALVDAVRRAAAEAGAARLSVQTEPDNEAALRLYRANGFVPVTGVQALMLPLPPGEA